MSPETYVRAQALALAIALAASATLGSALWTLVCALAGGLGAFALYLRYRGDVRAAALCVPPHRERLDLIVAGDARGAFAIGIVLSATLLWLSAERLSTWVAPASLLLLALAAAVILLSSLVDWYLILPRVSGLLGIRPCRSAEADHPRAPRTWREVTRWWYIHRIAAALALRFGISYAIVITVARHTSVPYGASLVAGAVVGGLAAYLAVVPLAIWQAGHPSLIIGRSVRRHSVEREPRFIRLLEWELRVPLLSRAIAGALRPPEYVFDVALEGVQLVAVAGREGELPRREDQSLVFERDPAKLEISDVGASSPVPAGRPFRGCRNRCSGINWYCIENPRCFDPK